MNHPGPKTPPFHFCLTLTLFCSMALHAQDNQMKFERFGTEDGLSSNIIYSIFQDSKGFLWIGTNDGLNRYDGYKFQVYRSDPKDSNSLSSNIIQGLIEDTKGLIWIGTKEGLCRLDPRTGKIIRIRLLSSPGKDIGVINWISNEELMVTSSGKLIMYNIHNAGERELTGQDSTLQSLHIHTNVTSDKAGNIYFIVNKTRANKIFRFDRQQKTIDHFKTISRSGIIKEMVRSFFVDSRNFYWMDGGHGTEVVHYPGSLSPENFQLVRPIKSISATINNFYEDRAGYIWLCTAKNLVRYDYSTNSFTEIFYRGQGLGDITNTIYEDRTGVLWVGSYSGLYKLNPGSKKFSHFTAGSNSNPSLPGNFILGLNASSDQRIWINYDWGTKLLSLLDIKKKSIEHYSYSHPKLKEFLRDGIKNKSKLKIEEFDNWFAEYIEPKFNPGALPYLMAVDPWERLWLIGGNEVRPYKGDNHPISAEAVDIASWKDEIFISTNGGGFLIFNTLTRKFSSFAFDNSGNSISGNTLTSLLVEENGNAWIGTNGAGLNYFDRAKQLFTHYTVQNGLCNNSIFSMVKDKSDRLWLGTGNGLSCFDIKKNKFRNFFRSDGLVNSEFNRYSALQLPDGKLLMGGMNGIDYFDPNVVLTEAIMPGIQITGFKVFNESITPASHVTLAHNKNYITINFAAMDFRNPAANSYAYKLDGIDKDWIMAGNQTSVSYATLSPGRYHFLVKGAGSDGAWNEKPAEVFFTIRTPWWRSGLFWSLTVLFAGSILYGFYQFRIRQLKKVFSVRTKISQDLHDEVGATLTSISYLSEVAKLHSAIGPTRPNEAIDKIGEFSRDMIGEMNDIVWAINPANDKFEKIESRMHNFASVLLATKNIEFDFFVDEKISNNFLGMQQRKNLYLVFKEAINNAAKYSGCSAVCVKICQEDHHVLMDISDNGKGFDENGNGHGNGLKNMKARAIEVEADLHIESIPGEGTKISLSVPLTQNTY